MKHHRYIAIALLLVIIAVPVIAFAQFGSTSLSFMRSIGGRVASVGPTAAIQYCLGIGPITIQPFISGAQQEPYFIRVAANGTPRVGGYILGLYNPVPDGGSCYNASGVPVPAYEITLYGVSR